MSFYGWMYWSENNRKGDLKYRREVRMIPDSPTKTNHQQERSHTTDLHRSIFKKNKDSVNNRKLKQSLIRKICSPTDLLLSPCSQKLMKHKSKLFRQKNKSATKLTFVKNHTQQSDDDNDLH